MTVERIMGSSLPAGFYRSPHLPAPSSLRSGTILHDRRRGLGEIRRRSQALQVYAEKFGVYGVGKVSRLNCERFGITRCTVEPLIRDFGLQGVI